MNDTKRIYKKSESITDINRQIYWIFKDKYAEKWSPEMIKDIARLKKGEPIDYIIGWKPFLNCKINLSKKPLIPRPETEFWTEKAISEIRKRKKTVDVADIFSGSGCIGISVLKNIETARVDFAEINKTLVKQIELNLKINEIDSSCYEIFQSDIFGKLKGRYDFILANPPYLSKNRLELIQKEVLTFEPSLALFSKKNGLEIIEMFLRNAPGYLKPKGQIWMEFDTPQKKMVENILNDSNFNTWEFHKDQYKKWRYVRIKK